MYMVSVVVFTYNQENLIRQTLDSIINQKTEYSFEVIIGEDHGTDGTRTICQEYADKYDFVRLLPSERNYGVVGNWVNCVKTATGKYLMNCGGDDYWHNPSKIQMQVDYMESHPQCVTLHTDIDVLHENTGRIDSCVKKKQYGSIPQGMIQQDILCGRGNFSAVTICHRLAVLKQYVPIEKFAELRFPCEDWSTMLVMAAHGEIHFLPVSTSTYRIGQESVSHERNYDSIRDHCKRDKIMVQYLYSLFPDFGPVDERYYDERVYFFLLRAAYDNNDYCSAKKFTLLCPVKDKYQKMAKSWITFQIARLYMKYWKK